MNRIPQLSDQTRGWLRFIWKKATTPDDWSINGEPHPWWDRTSTAPMCSFPRFDLGETAYILPVIADMTPAWREVYSRIADELVGRHTTFWGAIDWLTMIGNDPDQANYPEQWQVFLPERLRGRYDAPGWVANGVAPWGLQPDPIGADGNLFFRGFLNLLLSVYRSVSGDEKWEQPFAVAGYQNRRFDWTQSQIVQFMHDQWRERPQGMQCENTKIWPFCLSAAGLGMQLYDRVTDGNSHWVYDQWIDYAKKHFLVTNGDGDLSMFPIYYDPLKDVVCSFPDPFVAFSALIATPYIVPQAPEFGRYLYQQAVNKLGWNDPKKPVMDIIPDPRFLTIGLLVARDLGDDITQARLRERLMQRADPRWFGDESAQFGYWFGLDEPYPRGQLSALLMVCEAGEPGAWSKAFRQPNREKFHQPTVEGIDYPALDVQRAWNDGDRLYLDIDAGLPSQRGADTEFRVTRIPAACQPRLRCDGDDYPHWQRVDDTTIGVRCDISKHRFVMDFSTAGQTQGASSHGESTAVWTATSGVSASPRVYTPQASGGCPCC
ncbi:MAG: hypothetical protein ACPGZP_04330 [Panacagrimonas sp.]